MRSRARAREKAGAAAVAACVLMMVLRALSPAARAALDGGMLALAVLVVLGVFVPALFNRLDRLGDVTDTERALPRAAAAPVYALEWDAAAVSLWERPEGGVYDSLRALARREPHASLCAAYGLLRVMDKEASLLPPRQKQAFIGLRGQAREAARLGADSLDADNERQAVEALLKALYLLDR